MSGTLFAERTAGAPACRMLQRVDALARRFEQAWRNGERPGIADFLPGDGPARRAVLSELIHIDQELRLEAREPTRADPTASFTGGRQRSPDKSGPDDPSTVRRALEEALKKLARHDPMKARLVQLRFFRGLSLAAAAKCLGMSLASAERAWRYARAWLYAAMDRFGKAVPRGSGFQS